MYRAEQQLLPITVEIFNCMHKMQVLEIKTGITEWDKLPPAARAYLRALEELAGCPLAIVSTGPDRDANIVLQDPFA